MRRVDGSTRVDAGITSHSGPLQQCATEADLAVVLQPVLRRVGSSLLDRLGLMVSCVKELAGFDLDLAGAQYMYV
jgi:hypothetical protein